MIAQALFGACRVPELSDKDTVAVNPESCHVVVLANNQFYFFRALWPDGTVAVNEDDILEILTAIKADASQVSPEVSSRLVMFFRFIYYPSFSAPLRFIFIVTTTISSPRRCRAGTHLEY